MASLLKFSEAAALGIHALVFIAAQGPEGPVTVHALAAACRASEAHMMKVCQRLAKCGHLAARRGPHGGFSLAADPDALSLYDIYTALEGPLVLNHCLFQRKACVETVQTACVFGSKIREVEEDFVRYMKTTTLATIAGRCHLREEAI